MTHTAHEVVISISPRRLIEISAVIYSVRGIAGGPGSRKL
jgi:hypothetical protein